ncbi:hypothetical protein RJ640_023568 [Escallonia rubra]|uniref:Chlororespiratory reduction 4 n=1 Tax=Escallonia rubra TaxID=112253 RepID=A0AA88RCU1_9ASTE|nr:hypothetical protein RJ640_023568 [Escallonia rubra]
MKHKLASIGHLLFKYGTHPNLVTQIHAHAIALGHCKNQHLTSQLLNAYAKLHKPIEAQKVFSQIPNPDIISYTCLISLYLFIDRPNRAFSVFAELSAGHRPDGFSVVGALSGCSRAKNLTGGRIVHGMVFRFELGSEPIVGNALVDMYGRNGRMGLAQAVFDGMVVKDVASWTSLLNGFVKCDDIDSARRVFDEMPQRNVISWTAMIVGYRGKKTPLRALELFREMRAEGKEHPTSITIVAVLASCADIGALDFGRLIHGCISKSVRLHLDVSINNALMDVYCKSGMLDLAKTIFGEMPRKDLFSWSTMISGLALHGEGRYALEVFDDMLGSGVVPNEITFVSVLSACAHAGLISEGLRLFNRLISCYGLKPTIEHYGCMVDLLCRAGHLEEALELIERMPINPDTVIWRSFLSGCLGKRNWRLAEMAGKKVLDLEPDDDGVYILLWNVFSFANKWDDALRTRKMMRDQKIKKKPGCSWIEVHGIVHEFLAEDTVDHVSADVHLILKSMIQQPNSDMDFLNV